MAIARYDIKDGQKVIRKDFENAAVLMAFAVPIIKLTLISSLTLHLAAIPTTSQDFLVTLNSRLDSGYDTVLLRQDLSALSVVDLVWFPDEKYWLFPGDALLITYTNADTIRYGLEVTLEEVH